MDRQANGGRKEAGEAAPKPVAAREHAIGPELHAFAQRLASFGLGGWRSLLTRKQPVPQPRQGL